MSVVALHCGHTGELPDAARSSSRSAAPEYPVRFEAAIELLARRDLSALITHRYPLNDFARALETLSGSARMRQGHDHDRRGLNMTELDRREPL
jgi:hypothetical protein